MHRLPQYHRGNPRVECHNTYQVNQNNTPLSPRVFICKTYDVLSNLNIQSDKTKLQKVKTQFITTSVERGNLVHYKRVEGENIISSNYNSKACDTSRL